MPGDFLQKLGELQTLHLPKSCWRRRRAWGGRWPTPPPTRPSLGPGSHWGLEKTPPPFIRNALYILSLTNGSEMEESDLWLALVPRRSSLHSLSLAHPPEPFPEHLLCVRRCGYVGRQHTVPVPPGAADRQTHMQNMSETTQVCGEDACSAGRGAG